jgi:hypothetical protein
MLGQPGDSTAQAVVCESPGNDCRDFVENVECRRLVDNRRVDAVDELTFPWCHKCRWTASRCALLTRSRLANIPRNRSDTGCSDALIQGWSQPRYRRRRLRG